MADNNTLPEPKLRTEKYLNAIANNTAGGGGETAIIKKSKTITANGTYSALNEDFDGYEQVIANVPNSFTPADEGKVVSQGALVSQSSTAANQNGTVDTTLYNSIDIDVPNTYTAGDEGKVVDNGHLVAQTSTSALQNGTINTTTNNEVVVNVPNTYVAADEGKVVSNGGLVSQTSTNINTNGTVNTTTNNEVVVAVPNTYTAGDEGKVVHLGELVAQDTTRLIGENGVYTTTLDREITVNVPSPKPVDNVAFNIIDSQTGNKFTLFILPLSMPGTSFDCKVGICGYSDLTALSGTLSPENTFLLNDYFTQTQTLNVDAYDYYGAAGRKSITFVIDPATNTISYTQTVSTQDCICYGNIPTNH